MTRFCRISLAFCFLILFLLMTGCGGDTPTVPEDTDVDLESLVLPDGLAGRLAGYTIVRPDVASAGEVDLATDLRDLLIKAGCELPITTDWVKRGETIPEDGMEILVGNTNRPEVIEKREGLRYFDWAVFKEGNRMIIVGGSDEALETALGWFASNVLMYTGEGFSEAGDSCIYHREYRLDSASVAGTPIGEYTIALPQNVADRGADITPLRRLFAEELGIDLPVQNPTSVEALDTAKPFLLLKLSDDGKEGYTVRIQDKSIIIEGNNMANLKKGTDAFIEHFRQNESGEIAASLSLEGKAEYAKLEYYVSASGKSGASGTESDPFASLADAFNTAEEKAAAGDPLDITVHLAKGTYAGGSFRGHDSKISLIGEKGTVISSLLEIDGKDFKAGENGIYTYTLPENQRDLAFRNIYVNGELAAEAETEWYISRFDEVFFKDENSEGSLTTPVASTTEGVTKANQKGYVVIYVDAKMLGDIVKKDADGHYVSAGKDETFEWWARMQWYYPGVRADGIDWAHSDKKVTVDGKTMDYTGFIAIRLHQDDGINFLNYHKNVGKLGTKAFNYKLTGNIAFLDKENEFFYDAATGVLSYIPKKGVNMADLTVGIPTAEELTVFEDCAAVTLENITFTGTTSNFVSEHGHLSGQAGNVKHNHTSLPEAGWIDDAAVQCRNILALDIKNCEFRHLYHHAIYLAQTVRNVTIEDNTFETIGGSAICAPTTVYTASIANNYLHNIADVFHNCNGITLMKAKDTKILHNTIINTAYTAISVGWTWSWTDKPYGEYINMLNVEVAYNYIENYMYFMYDGGAIYLNGGNANVEHTELFNSMHDNYAFIGSHEGHEITDDTSTCWYCDGAASHIHVYNNVVWVDVPSMSRWSYISFQGSDGWAYNLNSLGQQVYRITTENNYFINLWQDYLTIGYGRVKALFYLYEHNSVIFTNRDLAEIEASQAGLEAYKQIKASDFTKTDESLNKTVNDIIAASGCEGHTPEPVDLVGWHTKSVTRYKDAANDRSMKDATYKDGDNVIPKK